MFQRKHLLVNEKYSRKYNLMYKKKCISSNGSSFLIDVETELMIFRILPSSSEVGFKPDI